MIACLNPCDAQIEENLSTLSYASKASFISNKPIKNEDPKTRQIEELKRQVKQLTEELQNANETIEWLSSLTGQNKNTAMRRTANRDPTSSTGNAGNYMDREGSNEPRNTLNRQDSAVTNKNSNAGSMGGPG